MHNQTSVVLQATNDFSLFWFMLGSGGDLQVGVRFNHRQDDVFDLTIERRYVSECPNPCSFTEEDVDIFLIGIAHAIELYTAKYPDRVVRWAPAEQIQEVIFRILFNTLSTPMSALFSIQSDQTGDRPGCMDGKAGGKGPVLLKRLTDTCPNPFSREQVITTQSQMFGNLLLVRLFKPGHEGRMN